MNRKLAEETHVRLISLRSARSNHPHSWSEIQSQIAEVKDVSDADIISLAARIILVDGREMLEVITVTDLVEDGDMDTPATGLRFRAPIIEHSISTRLH